MKAARGLRVEDEVGWLRRVLVCSPGEELRRVPPAERDRYLVEDLLWLPRAAGAARRRSSAPSRS